MRVLVVAVVALLLAAGSALPPGSPVGAAPKTYKWNGAGLTSGWTDGDNWEGKQPPPDSGDSIVDVTAAGASTITGVGGQISELRATGGTTLSGGSLNITRRVETVCVRFAIDFLTLTGSGEIAGGVIQGDFTNLGSVTQRPVRFDECLSSDGGMKTDFTVITSGSVLKNRGTWRANGAWLQGSNCCGTPTSSRVRNEPTGTFGGTGTGGFSITNIEFESRGRLDGRMIVDSSHTLLVGEEQVSTTRGVRADAVLTLRGGRTTIKDTFTVARGAVLRLAGEDTQLVGPGSIDTPAAPATRPAGILRFEGGQVVGTIQAEPRVRVEKLGNRDLLVRTLDGVNGFLWVKGPAALSGAGKLEIDSSATASFNGPTTVTGAVTARGTSCCIQKQMPVFHIGGTMTLPSGASLAIESAQLGLEGAIAGGGALTLRGGRHWLAANARLAVRTVLDATAQLTLPAGHVTIDSAVEQRSADVEGPSARRNQVAVVAGSGSWTWVSGDVVGAFEFDIPVELPSSGTYRSFDGRLQLGNTTRISGDVTFEQRSGVSVTSALTLENAVVNAPGSPAATMRVLPGGSLLVAGTRTSILAGAEVFVNGTLDLRSGGLGLVDGTLHSSEGTLLLKGQRLTASKITVQTDATLVGPGTVLGDVIVAGTVRMAGRGELAVRGDWRSLPNQRIELSAAGAHRDSISIHGHIDLAGRLALRGFTRPAGGTLTLLGATTLGGAFGVVTGKPPRSAVDYTGRAVILRGE